ncbi:MAG: hypothetical protein ACTSXY_03130, partial [Promethearchaeota archaeon]
QSLVKPLPDIEFNETCQLNAFLTHVFSGILLKEIIQKVKRGSKSYQDMLDTIKNDPKNIPLLIKNERFRKTIYNIIRNRVQTEYPEADLSFVDAFFKFFYLKEPNRRREIRSWLEGQIDDPNILKKIGLPAWVSDDQTPNYIAIKEEKAEKGIHTLSLLSNYYPMPLIVCFDQLEGLRGQHRTVLRFIDVVREIFTRCNNFLIVTCIFPSLWKEFEEYVDQSYLDRAGQTKIYLENLTENSAKKVLQKRLLSFHTDLQLDLSNAIDPFEDADIPVLLFRDVNNKESVFPIRQFIARSREAWKQWVLNKIPVELQQNSLKKITEISISKKINNTMQTSEIQNNTLDTEVSIRLNRDVETNEIDLFIQEQVKFAENLNIDFLLEEVPNEEKLFAEILNIFSFLISKGKSDIYFMEKIIRYKLVMPIYQRYSYNDSKIFCLAILNATGNRFTARIKNFLQNSIEKQFDDSFLIRDLRVNEFPNRGKGGEHLKKYSRYGHILPLQIEDLAVIKIIYSSIEDIRNQNWQIRNYSINLNDFYNWLIKSQYFLNSILFRKLIDTDFGKVLFYNSFSMQQPLNSIEFISNREISTKSTNEDMLSKTTLPKKNNNVVFPSVDSKMENIYTDTNLQTYFPHKNPTIKDSDLFLGTIDSSAIRLGWLGRSVSYNRRVALSLTNPLCMSLFGYMGSGKSYALATIIENALLPKPYTISQAELPLSVIAFNYRQNPNARIEYPSYNLPNDDFNAIEKLRTLYGLEPTSIKQINFITYEQELNNRKQEYGNNHSFALKFKPMELTMENWLILLKPPKSDSDYMNVLRNILTDLYYEKKLSLDMIKNSILRSERMQNFQKKRAMNRIAFAERFIDSNRNYEWKNIFKPGVLTVFDLRAAPIAKNQALMLCLILSDMVRRNAKSVNKMIVFDEAHEYMSEKMLVGELSNMLTQIRHDGISFVLASQFPENIPQVLFKFFDTHFLFKITNRKSFDYLKRQLPNIGGLTAQNISNLPKNKGYCYLVTESITSDPSLKLTLFEFRPRMTLHSGLTVQNINFRA